jgi:hypothetical protein
VVSPNIRAIVDISVEDKIDHSIIENGINEYSTNEKGEAKLIVLEMYLTKLMIMRYKTVYLMYY